MRIKRLVTAHLIFLIFSLTFLVQPFIALAIENIQAPEISPQHKLVAIKIPEHSLKVVNLGNASDPYARIIDIMGGKIVIEVTTGRGSKAVILRKQNAIQRVARFSNASDKSPLLYSSHFSKD